MFPRAVIKAATPTAPVIELDADRLEEAQHLFAAYGTEIGGALMLAALPQSYATAWGSRVLWANSRLQHDLVRRIKGTARFVLAVAQRAATARRVVSGTRRGSRSPTGLAAHPHPPWQQCVELRLYHQAIRERLIDERELERARLAARRKPGPADARRGRRRPVQAGSSTRWASTTRCRSTRRTCSGCCSASASPTFEVLERYGISWTADQQESYLHLWDVVGAYLGIGTRATSCSRSRAGTST